MATQKQIAVYLVDISGSMEGSRLKNCKKFIKSMKDTPDRFTIYTYGASPKETSYKKFLKTPAKGKTQIERAVNEMFTNYLLREKSHFVDFVLLTDAEDDIKDDDALKSNMAAAMKQYNDAGGRLDTSAVFVLKDGKWNDTANKIRGAFGGGDVYDNASLDDRLQETKAGIKECNDARNVYMKCKTEMAEMKQILERSKNDEKKEDEKQLVENVDKETKVIDNDMKQLENEVSGLLSADFLKEFGDGKENKSESKTAETETKQPPSSDIDNALKEIDNQENIKIEKIKEGWVVGSKCEIFSKSNKKWMQGQITKIFKHENEEWLEVKYETNNLKEIARFDKDIRPIQQDTEEVWLKLIKISKKLQQICSTMDVNIDKLKKLVMNDAAQSTIKQFEDLESLLNNITIKSVQSKVDSMKNDLMEAKKDILKLMSELEKKAKTDTNVTKVNKQIDDLENKKTRIMKIQMKVEKQIDDCLEKEIQFMGGDMTKTKKQMVKTAFKECMRANCVTVSQIGDKLKRNYMKVVVIAAGYMGIDVPKYESDTYEYGKWKCGKFGVYDVMNIKVLTEAECNAMYNAQQMEEKMDKYIDEMTQSIEKCKINANRSRNTIDEKFDAIMDSVNKRRNIVQERLKQLENQKLELYNNNLKKCEQMTKELKAVQIEFDNTFRDEKIHGFQKGKRKITLEAEEIHKKAESVFTNEITYSLDEEFDVQVKLDETHNGYTLNLQKIQIIHNNIGSVGVVTVKDMMPQVVVSSVVGKEVKIDINYKYAKHASSYALQYKEIGKNVQNYENVFMDEEKKDAAVTSKEATQKTFTLNLKYQTKYCMRSRIKIDGNYWTSYSTNKTFETHSFRVVAASHLLDGAKKLGNPNNSSGWCSSGAKGASKWFIFDVDAPKTVSSIKFKNVYADGDTIKNFTLYASSSETSYNTSSGWTTVQSFTSDKSTEWQTRTITSGSRKKSRYWKIYVSTIYGSDSNYTCIRQFNVVYS